MWSQRRSATVRHGRGWGSKTVRGRGLTRAWRLPVSMAMAVAMWLVRSRRPRRPREPRGQPELPRRLPLPPHRDLGRHAGCLRGSVSQRRECHVSGIMTDRVATSAPPVGRVSSKRSDLLPAPLTSQRHRPGSRTVSRPGWRESRGDLTAAIVIENPPGWSPSQSTVATYVPLFRSSRPSASPSRHRRSCRARSSTRAA